MADQAWLDQVHLSIPSEAVATGILDQVHLSIPTEVIATGRLDQVGLTIVWAETASLELAGSSAQCFAQLAAAVSAIEDDQSAAQMVKHCQDNYGEDYADDSLAKAFYDMEN